MAPKYQRSILVTGGTSGLGYETALTIAKQRPNYKIIIASRSDKDNAVVSINQNLKQDNVQFMPLDLGSLTKVRAFVAQWQTNDFPPIEALVFNAALQFPNEAQYTEDGYEKTFAISHLGHVLLFSLLRHNLSDTARIVIVASGVHDPEQKSGLPDAKYISAEQFAHPPTSLAQGNGRQHYTNTKLANIMYMYSLQRRVQAINARHGKRWTVNAFDPGLMPGTGLARDYSPFMRFIWFRIFPKIFFLLRFYTNNIHTTRESGEALARLAIAADVEKTSGEYFEGMKPIKSSKLSYDEEKQEDLWEWTVKTLATSEEEKRLFALADLA